MGKKTYVIQQNVKEALGQFKARQGHVRVPSGFKIPTASSFRVVSGRGGGDPSTWPDALVGLRLGDRVNTARKAYKDGRLTDDDIAHLESIGFVWDVHEWKYQRFMLAIRRHIGVYGHPNVLQSFVVPSEAPWSEEVWGLNLGHAVMSVRSQGTYIKDHPERKQELDDLHFDWRADLETSSQL
jgi:hypothetical protein